MGFLYCYQAILQTAQIVCSHVAEAKLVAKPPNFAKLSVQSKSGGIEVSVLAAEKVLQVLTMQLEFNKSKQ